MRMWVDCGCKPGVNDHRSVERLVAKARHRFVTLRNADADPPTAMGCDEDVYCLVASFLHFMFCDLAAVVLSEGQKARHAASIIRLSSDPYKILSSAPAVAHVYIYMQQMNTAFGSAGFPNISGCPSGRSHHLAHNLKNNRAQASKTHKLAEFFNRSIDRALLVINNHDRRSRSQQQHPAVE